MTPVEKIKCSLLEYHAINSARNQNVLRGLFVNRYRLPKIIATPPKLLPAITEKYQENCTAIRTMSLSMLE